MLPRVKIYFENGNLGLTEDSADGVLGLLCSGVAVDGKFELNKAYTLRSMGSLVDLGITADSTDSNAAIYKVVKEFYDNASDGTEVWLMAFPDTLKMSDILDKTQNYATALVKAANGRLRGLLITRTPASTYTPTITNGLDADVALAMTNGQALGEWATETLYAPLFVVVEGYGYNGDPTSLKDLHTLQYNRVAVLIGDTVQNSPNASIGMLAGRIASIGVQTNIGAVKTGAVAGTMAFIGAKTVELADVASLYDKGYISLRTYVGRSGYFFTDDPMATQATDDYRSLTYRSTIDKAYRIAYNTLLDLLLDNIPINSDGTVQYGIAKSWEALVEDTITSQMTANGELSADMQNGDNGVTCTVDTTVNILNNPFKVHLQVRPFAYAKMVDVYLGFQTIS